MRVLVAVRRLAFVPCHGAPWRAVAWCAMLCCAVSAVSGQLTAPPLLSLFNKENGGIRHRRFLAEVIVPRLLLCLWNYLNGDPLPQKCTAIQGVVESNEIPFETKRHSSLLEIAKPFACTYPPVHNYYKCAEEVTHLYHPHAVRGRMQSVVP